MKSKIIDGVEITWLGNAGFRLRGEGITIYLDPYGLSGPISQEDIADIILLTNEHQQSFDPDSIRIVRGSSTTTLLPENMSLQFRGDARRVEPGDELIDDLCIKGIAIEVVPSYTPDSSSGHKEAGVGYIVTIAGKRIYYAGVTGLIPEMHDISVDISILPVGACTMNEEQAAEVVAIISPQVVIPVSYECAGSISANLQIFAENVYSKVPGVEVLVFE